MKVFAVHFTNKTTMNYTAFAFTLQDGKYYFHKNENKSDYESFAEESNVMGIDCIGDEDDFKPMAADFY